MCYHRQTLSQGRPTTALAKYRVTMTFRTADVLQDSFHDPFDAKVVHIDGHINNVRVDNLKFEQTSEDHGTSWYLPYNIL
jgi:hypothetical protein